MDWSFMAAPAASMLGGLFGMSSAKSAAESQRKHQEELMTLQHKFNVDDYWHRYQWAAKDMRLAGLNPILAATNGIGGSINGTGLGQSSAVVPSVPDFGGVLNSAIATRNQRQIALKGLELQERTVANEEYKAQTERLNVENEIAIRQGHLDLAKQAQIFEQDLRSAWQNFAMENESKLTESKVQEAAANIRHMAAQDAYFEKMADVAYRNATVNEITAEIARQNGISHRALEAAQAVCTNSQAQFYEKYGKTQETQAELNRAQTALTNYKRSVAGIETISDVMKGVLSVAIGAKIGMDMVGSDSNRIGF